MIIKIKGKNINISEKNVRAYEKMNGFPPDENDVRVYISALCHPVDVDKYIIVSSDYKLSTAINQCIEQEVKDCCGDAFYEGA